MGNGDFPRVWYNYASQVGDFKDLGNPSYERQIISPSADNVDSFSERSRIESGLMIGPRIFSVGSIIYGAAINELHQEIVNMDEAVSALKRIKVEGGPGSISYKNYNIPSRFVRTINLMTADRSSNRASRQRLLKVAQDMNMLCVPEGGMNYDWDLTYIVDGPYPFFPPFHKPFLTLALYFQGMTTVEHSLPIPTLYDDVLTLYGLSGTGSTPTHIVNYGGTFGEELVWATQDLPNDPKFVLVISHAHNHKFIMSLSRLRRFTRHDILERLSESTSRPMNCKAIYISHKDKLA